MIEQASGLLVFALFGALLWSWRHLLAAVRGPERHQALLELAAPLPRTEAQYESRPDQPL
jgi:hypothetical protein